MNLNEAADRTREVLDLHLFSIAGTSITVATLVLFFMMLVASLVASRIAQAAAGRALRRRHVGDEGAVTVTQRLVHYFVVAVGFGVALHTIGINLTAFFAAGAIFAVGLGFAMQNIAQNFVSGIIMLVERSITPGDVLQLGGQLVLVRRQGIRTTIVQTPNDEQLIVPNAELIQTTVTNYTLDDSLFRIRTQVGVAYDSDLALVRSTLVEAATGVACRVDTKEPVVLLSDFGDHAVIYDVSVWVERPWQSPAGRSELNETLWWALKDAGITIAFQQLDVHFDAPVTAALSTRSVA